MYSLRDAAKACGVQVRTMRQWIRDGKINAVKDSNGWYWRIPESEIERMKKDK